MSARIKARIRQNKLIVWKQYIELADSAYGLGKFDVGDKMLRAAAKDCTDDAEMCLVLAQCFERLRKGRAVESDYARSERLLRKAIDIYGRISDEFATAQIARLLIELAVLAAENNKHEVALRYFGKSLIVGKRSKAFLPEEHLGEMCHLHGLWTKKGRHEEALIVYTHCCRLTGAVTTIPYC